MLRFVQGNITVDEDFARFGSKSYAINKINSVDIRSQRQGGEIVAAVFGTLGVVFVLVGVWEMQEWASSAIFTIGVGAALIWLAVRLQRAAKQVTYTLYITTSSAEAQAMQSKDQDEVLRLRSALEAAMAIKPAH